MGNKNVRPHSDIHSVYQQARYAVCYGIRFVRLVVLLLGLVGKVFFVGARQSMVARNKWVGGPSNKYEQKNEFGLMSTQSRAVIQPRLVHILLTKSPVTEGANSAPLTTALYIQYPLNTFQSLLPNPSK